VYGYRRRYSAGPYAPECIYGEKSVLRGLSRLYSQYLAEPVDYLLCSLYVARRSQTYAYNIFSLGFKGKERVKRDYSVYLGYLHTRLLRYSLLYLTRNVTVLILYVTQNHHRRCFFTGIPAADLTDHLSAGLANMCHTFTSRTLFLIIHILCTTLAY